jgi:XTP/dITP diphosphohydrolase
VIAMQLFFGTTNGGKLRELSRMVDDLPVKVVSPADLAAPLPEVVEDGETFRENAEKKAVACARFAGMLALADDSGLCVEALGGAPGVHSARWSEADAPASAVPVLPEATRQGGIEVARAHRDGANNEKLLRSLAGVPDGRRGAAYVAVLALARPDGRIVATVEGTCRGRIGREGRGTGGFGYDPYFVPEGRDGRTMAELDPAEKDALSHRGAAFRALRPVLERLAFDKAGEEG